MVQPAPEREFVVWPLHITVVPWFPVEDEARLDKLIGKIASAFEAFVVNVGNTEMFGAKKDLAVSLVEPSTQLEDLHQAVYHSLEKNGFHIHQKDFLGQNYRPHITHQGKNRPTGGEELIVSSISLVRQLRQKKTGAMIKSAVKEYFLR
jgi:2'-5' RNA ligase